MLVTFETPLGMFGFEDMLLGFTGLGIASVVGELFLKAQEQKPRKKTSVSLLILFAGALAAGGFLIFLMRLLGVHSFYATLSLVAVTGIIMLVTRRDLVPQMIISAILFILTAVPAYVISLAFNPTWIQEEWMLHNLSGLALAGIPVEEFIWFFAVALMLSIAWEYSRGIYVKK